MGALHLVTRAEEMPMIPPSDVKELYEKYSETVYRSALRVTGNPADAEDALQTVFTRLLKRTDRVDAGNSPPRYFRRAATNAALDILRRRASRAEAQLDDAFPRAAPESSAFLKEQLRRALARLEPADAELFVLRFVEGLDNAELAALYGTEKARVAMRVFRVRQQLQAAMKR